MSSKKVVIAIVNSSSFGISYPEHLRKLEEFAELVRVDIPNDAPASVFHEKLHLADGIIASVTPVYTRDVLLGLPKLQVLARHGVGCDNVDLLTCAELGIAVSKVGPEVERESVAQMAVGLMNASVRRIVEGCAIVKAGEWAKRAKISLGVDFKGATIGLVGIGAIGKTVARILTLGFQANVIAYDPYVSAEEIRARHATKVGFDELLAKTKINILRGKVGPTAQNRFGAPIRWPKSLLWKPPSALSINDGKNAASATPTLALAATTRCWAATMSGRRCSRVDGTPTGIGGTPSSAVGAPGGLCSPLLIAEPLTRGVIAKSDGDWPSRAAIACSIKARCARLCCCCERAASSCAWARARSSPDETPPWRRRLTRSSART